MVHTSAITVAAAALLVALPVNAGLYSKSSPVIQLDGKNYDRLIAQSNYTSIVEFYAPWCGHCKNLQPAYEKVAKGLSGLAKVAAVDCDEESNKQFCGGFGVTGFPTLKIVRPGNKPGSPIVEDYQGPRTAKAIVDAVIDKVPNHVKRVDDKTLEAFLADANDTAKALLFTDKGKTSALLKAVAIDFKGSIKVAQIRNTEKEKGCLELFGVSTFPTLLLLPGGPETPGIVYDGVMNKEGMVKFLSQVTAPNPDPAPAKVKTTTKKDEKKASKPASSSGSSSEAPEAKPKDEEATEDAKPEEVKKPIEVAPAPPIDLLLDQKELQAQCLGSRTGTCILCLLPGVPDEVAVEAVSVLSELAHMHKIHKRKLFPFYAITAENGGYKAIKEALGLSEGTEVIAINARRGWWRQLPRKDSLTSREDVTPEAIHEWVDAIRMGEGVKEKLPEKLIPAEEPAAEEKQEPVVDKEPEAQQMKAEEPAADVHDEL